MTFSHDLPYTLDLWDKSQLPNPGGRERRSLLSWPGCDCHIPACVTSSKPFINKYIQHWLHVLKSHTAFTTSEPSGDRIAEGFFGSVAGAELGARSSNVRLDRHKPKTSVLRPLKPTSYLHIFCSVCLNAFWRLKPSHTRVACGCVATLAHFFGVVSWDHSGHYSSMTGIWGFRKSSAGCPIPKTSPFGDVGLPVGLWSWNECRHLTKKHAAYWEIYRAS